MSAHERVWLWYVATVSVIVALFGREPAGPSHRPGAFLAVHAVLLVTVLVVPRLVPAPAQRWVRGVLVAIGLPVVFSWLGAVLPGVHPEPWEWTWIAADRALLGCDPTVAVQAWLGPFAIEILQLCYATFYFVPIAAMVGAWRTGGGVAFDRALLSVQFGFLVSYVGYLLWPTLPPYRFLDHGAPLAGVWLAEPIHGLLDRLEGNRWDCFPSGHTMLSVLALWLAWRDARRWFWWLLPLVTVIVFSTVALRYHYVVDVLAGLLFVPPTLWVAGRLRALR